MDKLRRSERIVLLTKELIENPYKSFPLAYFAELFQAAKSSISEDISLVKDTLRTSGAGLIETQVGAAGGVKFKPVMGKVEREQFANLLCTKLSGSERIVPGGFIYLTDIIFDPQIAQKIGRIFATLFAETNPDYILTIETKGIPLALFTARAFGVPLVIVRDESKVSEGSSVSINYVSGSTRRIQTMALTRRALPKGSRVLIIDDFMKAGGTAKGMLDLMVEFEAEVLGIGVLISTTEPRQKLVDHYISLLELAHLDEDKKKLQLKPSAGITQTFPWEADNRDS